MLAHRFNNESKGVVAVGHAIGLHGPRSPGVDAPQSHLTLGYVHHVVGACGEVAAVHVLRLFHVAAVKVGGEVGQCGHFERFSAVEAQPLALLVALRPPAYVGVVTALLRTNVGPIFLLGFAAVGTEEGTWP